MKLRQIFESKQPSVGIIFGRFNPPHQGHRAAWEMAAQNDQWFVGTNQSTQGPKDPLPYDIKVKAMLAIMPEVKGHIVPETSWLTLASKVYKKYGSITLNVYTDEEWVTKALVQYNGVEGAHGFYNFADIQQHPTPRLSSATALRAAVAAGDRDAFSKAAGVDADTPVAGHSFFDVVAHYLAPHAEKEKAKAAKKKAKEPAVGEMYKGHHKTIKHHISQSHNPDKSVKDSAKASARHHMHNRLEEVDIGREWMSDTELDQYVPDHLQQQWRELLGYDMNGNPSALWANMTGGYEPDVNDRQHRALMVKVANKWFAAKKIPNVKFFSVRDADDELEWLVQIDPQGPEENDSPVIKHMTKSLENPPKVMQHRAKRDQERERQYMGTQIAKRDRTSKDEWGDFKEELDELSTELLGRYKKAAGADASRADKEGDYERANKRFRGIVKATKKQFANDEKKTDECAGVGIITKQNSTVDVNKNTPKKNLKAFKLI